MTDSQVEVLVETSQIVGGTYTPAGTRLVGLVDVTVSRSQGGLTVTNYRWLLAPANAP